MDDDDLTVPSLVGPGPSRRMLPPRHSTLPKPKNTWGAGSSSTGTAAAAATAAGTSAQRGHADGLGTRAGTTSHHHRRHATGSSRHGGSKHSSGKHSRTSSSDATTTTTTSVPSQQSTFTSLWGGASSINEGGQHTALAAAHHRDSHLGIGLHHKVAAEHIQTEHFNDPMAPQKQGNNFYDIKDEGQQRFKSIWVPGPGKLFFFREMLVHIVNLHITLMRAVWFNSLLSNLASPREKRAISRKHGVENGPTGKGAFNYIVWRRSTMFIVLVFVVLDACFDFNNAYHAIEEVSQLSILAGAPLTRNITVGYLPEDIRIHFDLPDPNKWVSKGVAEPMKYYLERMFQISLARLTRTTAALAAAIDVMVFIFSLAIIYCCYKSFVLWVDVARSTNYMRTAWAFAFLSPFLSSLIPFRLWFDSGAVDDVANAMRVEWARANIQTGIQELEDMATRTCSVVLREADESPIKDKLLELCASTRNWNGYPAYGNYDGLVEVWLPKREYDFSVVIISVDVNLLHVHRTCGNIRKLLKLGILDVAVDRGVDGCRQYRNNLRGALQTDSDNDALAQVITMATQQLKFGSEVLVSVSYAVLSLRIMIPAALALAPGFLRGSLKSKALVPQNSIPGMFTLVLPWLYCPLTWCIYNILFQLIGDGLLMVALFLMSFSPMVFFVVGYQMQITRPMDDVVVFKIIISLWKSFYVVMMLGNGLLIVWIVQERFFLSAFDHIWSPRVIASMLAAGLTKFMITTLACVDWILLNIIQQRYYERYLMENRAPLLVGTFACLEGQRRSGKEYTRGGMNTRLRGERNLRLEEVSKLFNPLSGDAAEQRRAKQDARALVTGEYEAEAGRIRGAPQMNSHASISLGSTGGDERLLRAHGREVVLGVDPLGADIEEAERFGGPGYNPDLTFRRMHVTPEEENPIWELYDIWGYLSTFHLHLYRGIWLSSLGKPMAGPRERGAISEMYGTKMKIGKGPNNYMAWRRSSILVTFLLSVVTSIYAFLNLYEGWVTYAHQVELAAATMSRNITFDYLPTATFAAFELCDPKDYLGTAASPDGLEPFDCYTRRIVLQTAARMSLDSRLAANIVDLFFVFFTALSMGAVWMALRNWIDLKKSTKYLRYGWIMAFAAPLIVSVAPVRLLVATDELGVSSAAWTQNFARYTNLERKREIVDQACIVVEEERQIAPLREMWIELCGATSQVKGYPAWGGRDGAVETNIPHDDVDLIIFYFRFSSITDACGEGRVHFDSGFYEAAMNTSAAGCVTYRNLLAANSSGQVAAVLDVSPDDLDAAITDIVSGAEGTWKIAVGVWYAFIGLRVLLPAALALAPGLIRASLKIKSLVPQSSLPGMFVLIMPWLYCPLVWCVYNTIFQLIGNVYLMIGSLSLAYAPMSFFVFGVMYNVTRPMDDSEVFKVVGALWRWFYAFILVGYVFCGIFFVTLNNQTTSYLQVALAFVFSKNVLIYLVVSMLTKYFFTTLVAMDWLLRGIVEQRWYDIYLLTGSHPVHSEKAMQSFEMHGQRHRMDSVRTMLDSRIRRLDQLCLLWKTADDPGATPANERW